MASAKVVMTAPVEPEQTGVELQLSIEEARVLRCFLGSMWHRQSVQAIKDFAAHGAAARYREEYAAVANLMEANGPYDGALHHIFQAVRSSLPEQFEND